MAVMERGIASLGESEPEQMVRERALGALIDTLGWEPLEEGKFRRTQRQVERFGEVFVKDLQN